MSACLYNWSAGELYLSGLVNCLGPCPAKGLFLTVPSKVLVSWWLSLQEWIAVISAFATIVSPSLLHGPYMLDEWLSPPLVLEVLLWREMFALCLWPSWWVFLSTYAFLSKLLVLPFHFLFFPLLYLWFLYLLHFMGLITHCNYHHYRILKSLLF